MKANIRIMSPKWILDSHMRYINGEDLALREVSSLYSVTCAVPCLSLIWSYSDRGKAPSPMLPQPSNMRVGRE